MRKRSRKRYEVERIPASITSKVWQFNWMQYMRLMCCIDSYIYHTYIYIDIHISSARYLHNPTHMPWMQTANATSRRSLKSCIVVAHLTCPMAQPHPAFLTRTSTQRAEGTSFTLLGQNNVHSDRSFLMQPNRHCKLKALHEVAWKRELDGTRQLEGWANWAGNGPWCHNLAFQSHAILDVYRL